MEEAFETIRLELTERQIKLLGSYVRTTLFTRPSDADGNDDAVLVGHSLIEPIGGMWHKESFVGSRAAEQTAGTYHPTERGRAWFDWYDEQPKS